MKLPRAEDRAFFERVSAAVFSNPFGPQRHAIDLQLAEIAGAKPSAVGREALLSRVVGRVDERLHALAEGGSLRLAAWSETERPLVEQALLFSCFHRFADEIDVHVAEQITAGARPVPAGFAPTLLRELVHHGMPRPQATRMVAVLFQMRRAFTFIDRTLTGGSPCMRALRQALWSNVFTHDVGRYDRWLWSRMEDFSTILLGGTGTGKGTAAAAIGRAGFIPFDARKGCFVESFTEAFVAVNLSQYPKGLIESELFGHVKGAFTGAIERYDGALSRCSPHGAIFLDEIGEAETTVQIKLLRVLQERELVPVGSHQAQRFSGRVIAATNRDLDELRRSGRMRDDFYYRLCSDVIEVPSLRQRLREDPDELPRLLEAVLERMLGEPAPTLVDEVVAVIGRELPRDYPWPGNVRELEQCVRRVLITQRYTGDRTVRVAAGARERLRRAIDGEELSARELLRDYCRMLYERHGTYEEVARRTGLDRRTVKRHVDEAGPAGA
ncbi:sigma 54-interacting transcriptional regulator [Paraliomyxa miuraensis]|uniref:sigma 54-interacting transcriptional regulator n=1 Tax=Paraliomyxa miuraensis TaxID=376150 RepID=UPI0022566DFC|nr:sigma 54-interacting transcriptional regulator [Paraliomyxa miuraensis]MCX4245218.1 sigma 54-interacting transcriptional regulator [Paraliomyxa miuraensis]